MNDPGFILDVRGGEYFFYLANNGIAGGVRRGPYPDLAAAHEAATVLVRLKRQRAKPASCGSRPLEQRRQATG